MNNISIDLDEMQEIMYQNESMLELIHGFCLNLAQDIDEVHNLIPALEFVLKNHKQLWDIHSEIDNYIFKCCHSDIFK